MGRKVHPLGFRLGIIKDWESRWYADRNYTDLVHEDNKIRKMVSQRLAQASLARIDIQRSANQIEVTLHTAKPGVVIGKGGTAVDDLRKAVEQMTGKKVKINIEEIKQPELNAYLIAESIAEQNGRRVSYRRALKQSILRARRAGAKGIRVRISGRLGGAEMARSVWEREGRVPLHTIRADIDYGIVHAHTTYGRIGVKVWVYRGDVIERKGGDTLLTTERPAAMAQPRPDRRDRRGDRRGEGRSEGRGERPEGRGGERRERSDEAGGRHRFAGTPTPAPERVATQQSSSVRESAGTQPAGDSAPMGPGPETTNSTGGTEQ